MSPNLRELPKGVFSFDFIIALLAFYNVCIVAPAPHYNVIILNTDQNIVSARTSDAIALVRSCEVISPRRAPNPLSIGLVEGYKEMRGNYQRAKLIVSKRSRSKLVKELRLRVQMSPFIDSTLLAFYVCGFFMLQQERF